MQSKEDFLTQVYFDPANPASFSGVEKIYKYAKIHAQNLNITRGDVKGFLQKQETYTEHRQIKHKFSSQSVIASSINYQWDIDLASMISLSKHNNGYKYFLLCIDCLSRYVYTRPLKSKQPEEIIKAFENIFSTNPKPERIRSDRGKEFTAKITLKMFEKFNIKHFTSNNLSKASLAERCIKSIKGKLTKAMHARGSHIWEDLLTKVTDSYNSSVHSVTGIEPKNANSENEVDIWIRVHEFKPKLPRKKSKKIIKNEKIPASRYAFKIGDAVKLAITKYVFQREYSQRWTSEVFFISHRYTKENIQLYSVKDFNNKEIEGSFQMEEIQKVHVSDDTEYKIEAILGRKTINKVKYVFVKWQNYTNDFNSWIKASEINENLNKLQISS